MSSAPNPGDVLAGRYRVERTLGEGGMGVVVAAQHLMLGERVAVKLLLPEAAAIPGVLERFQREARAAATIQSEHVARVMDVGVLDDGRPYLVMEYLEGQDLSQLVESGGPLPVQEAVDHLLEAAIGVASAHALGIVHRDLKPSNLFLTSLPNGRKLVKVLDFGIAKHAADGASANLTSTFSALGSAAYMSPEQVRMAKSADARTDVWAFGVVLFELLTGQMPFDGESVTALAAAITADPPRSLSAYRPEVPAELEAVVLRCLDKNRDQRMQSLALLAQALSPFGGSRAPMLCARVAEALGPATAPASAAVPASAVTAGDAAALPVRNVPASAVTVQEAISPSQEGGATRATWAVGEGSEGSRSSALRLPAIVLAVAATLGGIAAWASSRSDTPPAASTVAPASTPSIAAPAAAPEPPSASPIAPVASSPPGASQGLAPAPARSQKAGGGQAAQPAPRPVQKKPAPAPRKKPLVTNL